MGGFLGYTCSREQHSDAQRSKNPSFSRIEHDETTAEMGCLIHSKVDPYKMQYTYEFTHDVYVPKQLSQVAPHFDPPNKTLPPKAYVAIIR